LCERRRGRGRGAREGACTGAVEGYPFAQKKERGSLELKTMWMWSGLTPFKKVYVPPPSRQPLGPGAFKFQLCVCLLLGNSRVAGARPNHQAHSIPPRVQLCNRYCSSKHTHHQPIGGSDANHQGIWSPFRAGQSLCVFITVKLFAWGEGDSGGHVLRETTSRGLRGLVCLGT
jgi:hypothetical protein